MQNYRDESRIMISSIATQDRRKLDTCVRDRTKSAMAPVVLRGRIQPMRVFLGSRYAAIASATSGIEY